MVETGGEELVVVQIGVEGWRDGTWSGGVVMVGMGFLVDLCIDMLDLTRVF